MAEKNFGRETSQAGRYPIVRHAQCYSHVDWPSPYRTVHASSYATEIDPRTSIGSNLQYAACASPVLHRKNALVTSGRADIASSFYNSVSIGYRGAACAAACTQPSRMTDFHQVAVYRLPQTPPPPSPRYLYPSPLPQLRHPHDTALCYPWLHHRGRGSLRQPPVAIVAPMMQFTPHAATQGFDEARPPPPPKRRSRSLNPSAVALMQIWYARNIHHPYPPNALVAEICIRWGLRTDQVKKWFANKRMRSKSKLH